MIPRAHTTDKPLNIAPDPRHFGQVGHPERQVRFIAGAIRRRLMDGGDYISLEAVSDAPATARTLHIFHDDCMVLPLDGVIRLHWRGRLWLLPVAEVYRCGKPCRGGRWSVPVRILILVPQCKAVTL